MSMLKGLIEKYELRGRFIPIGQRNDIFECYKHCDIYLSSYPLGGGLMAQYAAHAGLPILAMANPTSSGKIEEMVCQKHDEVITFNRMDTLVEEASHLIGDINYRRLRGQAMSDCVIGIKEFNLSFKESVVTGKTQYPLTIDYKVKLHYLNVDDKLKLENKTKGYHKSIFSILGWGGLPLCPRIWMVGVAARFKSSRIGGIVCK